MSRNRPSSSAKAESGIAGYFGLLAIAVFSLVSVAGAFSDGSPMWQSPTYPKGSGRSSETVRGVQVRGTVRATITEWEVATEQSMPTGIFSAKRTGLKWYSGLKVNLLGTFDEKTGKFEEFHLRPGSHPGALVEHAGSGVQTRVFFTSLDGGFIGEFDYQTREVREFRIRGGKLLLEDLAFGINGEIWFTAAKAEPPLYPQGSKIGRLSLYTSEIKLADIPTKNASPFSLAVNSKGIPFFTERDSPRLGSIDQVTMKVVEYDLPDRGSGVRGLAITSDDVIWYTDYKRGCLGSFVESNGTFSEWPSPSGPRSRPGAIATLGKVIWYTETGSEPNMLVRFDPQESEFQSWPIESGASIERMYANEDGSLWLTLPMANQIARVTTAEGGR